MREETEKTKRVSHNWALLIAKIYEVDPLICSSCGKKIKIISFVTCAVQIRAILSGIGWPTDIPEFDPACECELNCQLISETIDGFPRH